MILSICPHHPTLLTILLDVCLMWNLGHESYTLLRSLLVTSVSSSATSPSPLSHPAHSFYLLDLLDCTTGTAEPKCAADFHPIFTQISFTRIVVDVLRNSIMPDAWTCKAVTKFARLVRKSDFTSFVHIAAGLADVIGNIEGGEHTKKRGWKAHEAANTTSARERLDKWVITILHHLWTNMDLTGPELLPPSAMWPIELQAVVELLRQAQSSDLHLVHAKSMTMESKLPYSIVCVATCCLTSFSSLSENTINVRYLVSLLSEITPITSTFDELVTLILDGEDPWSAHMDWQAGVMRKLQILADLLRSHSLLRLEASLWACALRCLERNSYSESRFRPDVEELKNRVIDAVDEAESRCFGSALVAPSVSKLSQRRKRLDADEGAVGEEWEWEEMVRCWIRRSPVVKRTRLDVKQPRVLRSTMIRQRKHSSIFVSPPISTSSSTVSSRSPGGATKSQSSTDEESHDDGNENHRVSNVRPRPVVTRRVSNFASILADAQMNRIILHSGRTSTRHKPSTGFYTSIPSHMPIRQKNIAPEEDLVPALYDAFSTLPSDDSLDLFAYTLSSPIAHR